MGYDIIAVNKSCRIYDRQFGFVKYYNYGINYSNMSIISVNQLEKTMKNTSL